jgi:hypothetical protein
VHHVNRKPDGGSALHEAVAHKHEAVVELLLRHRANPFVENCKGYTAMDIACSTRNVPLLRRLEQCAPFAGWLQVKVPQFGGLGSAWQRRWVVVSHRFPSPAAPPASQLTHCVFLAYKNLASTAPACRLWLDGARAREVFNPKAEARLQRWTGGGPRCAQAGVTLHRKHEQPSGGPASRTCLSMRDAAAPCCHSPRWPAAAPGLSAPRSSGGVAQPPILQAGAGGRQAGLIAPSL